MATWSPNQNQEEDVLHARSSRKGQDYGSEHYVDRHVSKAPPMEPSPRGYIKKKILCIAVGTFVLVAILVGAIAIAIATRVNDRNRRSNGNNSGDLNYLSTACQRTLYPTVCYNSLSNSTNDSNSFDPANLAMNSNGVAKLSLTQDMTNVKGMLNSSDPNLKTVAQDCISQLQDSIDSLDDTLAELQSFSPGADNLDDMRTWTSAALTSQQTCLDSFEELGINTNGSVGDFLTHGNYTAMLLSNALAFVKTLQQLTANFPKFPGNRRLLSADIETFSMDSVVDLLRRRLLQTSNSSNSSNASVVVAKDGSGDYVRIQDALNNAPAKLTGSVQYVIQIKAGTYYEKVLVPKSLTNIVFVGAGIGQTIISGNLSVKGSNVTTSLTATLTVQGKNFIGRDFTVENTAGAVNQQAVALRVTADFSAFQRCQFLGKQDTLYTHTNRQFYTDCQIVGTVDFIFGNAAVVFQGCQVLASTGVVGQQNTYTASGRLDPNQNTGIALQNCTLDGDASLTASNGTFPTYLGRPWKPYARTVVIGSTESGILNPAGWLDWNGQSQDFSLVYFAEYQNVGPGSGTSQRVSWSKQIQETDAAKFTVDTFLQGDSWLQKDSIVYQTSV